MNRDKQIIYLKDIVAEWMIRWKLIALVGILGAACGVGAAWYKNRAVIMQDSAPEAATERAETTSDAAIEDGSDVAETASNSDYDTQVTEAKSRLTDLEVSKVDGLYAQYLANISMRDSLAESIRNSAVMHLDAESAAVQRSIYLLETDQAYLANNINSFILDDAFYTEAASILGDDIRPESLDDLFSVWKGSIGGSGDTVYVEQDGRNTSIIYLQALAFTSDQAEEIIALMEDRLEEAVDEFKSLDLEISLTHLGTPNMNVTSSTVQDIQRTLVNELNGVANQIVSMENNEIAKLTEDEKTYYELLMSNGKGLMQEAAEEIEDASPSETETIDENAQTIPISGKTCVKYMILGFAGGMLLSMVGIFLYLVLLCKKIYSRIEVESGTGLPTLVTYDNRKQSRDPIVNGGMRIQSGEGAIRNGTGYAEILSTRIRSLMEQNQCGSLYIVDTKGLILQELSIQVASGSPEQSEEQMQQFLDADCAIMVTRIMETEESTLSNALNLCKVHNKPILGNIVIY